MNRLEQFRSQFFIICALVCAGIVWGCSDAAVDAPASEPEEDILSLAQLLEADKDVMFVSHSPIGFDDATAAGRTASGYYYELLTGEALNFMWGLEFTPRIDRIAREVCTLENGANLIGQNRFKNCLKEILDRGDCIYMWRDDDGDTHGKPTECEE